MVNKINLNEINFENVGQWPLVIKYAFTATVAALIMLLGYWFLIKPTLDQIDTLTTQQKTLKIDFERKQQMAANLERYKQQLTVMNQRFGTMLQQLPTKNEMPGLLEDISKTGVASGLTFELFAPQPEVAHDFYIELPIEIIVLGNYHQLAIFLSRIAQMSRIVTLHDLDITEATSAKPDGITGDSLEMKITAKIYRYRLSK